MRKRIKRIVKLKPISSSDFPTVIQITDFNSLITKFEKQNDDFWEEIDKSLEEPDKLNRKSDFDPYDDFSWGGLSGEEAYDAMWNCD
jgi:hypothetical protein